MNIVGRVMLMVLCVGFLAASFYAFVDWFSLLQGGGSTLETNPSGHHDSGTKEIGLVLFTLCIGSLFFAVVAALAYLHRRRLHGN